MSMPSIKKDFQVKGVEEDRISHLPDEIICRILSLIPTRYSIRTSVLSKRWEHLWIFAPKLDLEFNGYYYQSGMDGNDNSETGFWELCMDSFARSINNLLVLRGNLCVESFRLSYVWHNRETDHRPANALLCLALTCNIRELHLKTTRYKEVKLPQMLFTCKTLVVLKLKSEFVIDVLEKVSLPNLKTLVLKHVICLVEESIPKLLSGCPVLEELQLRRDKRECRKVLVYDVSHPTMKRLTLQVGDMGNDADDLPRKIIINSPNLEFINLERCWPGDLVGCSLPSVVEAHINIDKHRLYSNEEIIEHGKKVLALLKSIANVKRLFLTHDRFVHFLYVIAPDLPKFCNLVLLKIALVSLLIGFLESSPKLEVLSLPMGFFYNRWLIGAESGWNKPQHAPECFFHSVKSIQIDMFFGKEDELNIVKYILENAMKLEKMTLFCNHSPTSVEFVELQRELKNHSHGSSFDKEWFFRLLTFDKEFEPLVFLFLWIVQLSIAVR